jgi:hypothetical protein
MKTIHHLLAGCMILILSGFFCSTASVPALAQAIDRQIAAGQQCRLCRPHTMAPNRSVFEKRREGEGHPTRTAIGDTTGSVSGRGSISGSGSGIGSIGGSGSGSFAGSGSGSFGGTGSIGGSGSAAH